MDAENTDMQETDTQITVTPSDISLHTQSNEVEIGLLEAKYYYPSQCKPKQTLFSTPHL